MGTVEIITIIIIVIIHIIIRPASRSLGYKKRRPSLRARSLPAKRTLSGATRPFGVGFKAHRGSTRIRRSAKYIFFGKISLILACNGAGRLALGGRGGRSAFGSCSEVVAGAGSAVRAFSPIGADSLLRNVWQPRLPLHSNSLYGSNYTGKRMKSQEIFFFQKKNSQIS